MNKKKKPGDCANVSQMVRNVCNRIGWDADKYDIQRQIGYVKRYNGPVPVTYITTLRSSLMPYKERKKIEDKRRLEGVPITGEYRHNLEDIENGRTKIPGTEEGKGETETKEEPVKGEIGTTEKSDGEGSWAEERRGYQFKFEETEGTGEGSGGGFSSSGH